MYAPEWYLTPVASYIVMSVKQRETANRELASPNSNPTAVVTACRNANEDNIIKQHLKSINTPFSKSVGAPGSHDLSTGCCNK